MAEFPSFAEFYGACHRGLTPFPWQSRLAALVAAGGWPNEIGVQTGLGKTACIDIAIWALARDAYIEPSTRSAPTRTWYVVNRRLLVDSGFEHVRRLQGWLRDPESLRADWREAMDPQVATIGAVGRALSSLAALGSEQGPLHVTRLRGGADLGDRVPDPSQPAIVLATVPMFASRLLFRGYGSSQSMRPVDAALAGTDSLVLLDEAHLAKNLVDLMEPLAECDPGNPSQVLHPARSRVRFVSMTATGRSAKADSFRLSPADNSHPVVAQRLSAPKPTRLVEVKSQDLARTLANETAVSLVDSPAPTSCVVFTNSPATARATHHEIEKRLKSEKVSATCLLLTGQMREREAEGVRRMVQDSGTGAPSNRDRTARREQHLVVVATQTLEVGADVDFDHLVTETAGARSLVQRFGRLNRLGLAHAPSAVVVHPADARESPVYGDEPTKVWERLSTAGPGLNLSPGVIGEVIGDPRDEPPPTGELLSHHLWDWAKTSAGHPPAARPEFFFDALEQQARVAVAWRELVPTEGVLVPPLSGEEAVDLPVWEVRKALEERGLTSVVRLAPDRKTVGKAAIDELRAGDQVILPADFGMYDEFGWNPSRAAGEEVADISLLRAGLPLLPRIIHRLIGPPIGETGAADDSFIESLDSAANALRSPTVAEDPREVETERASHLAVIADRLRRCSPPAWLRESEGADWTSWRDGICRAIESHGPAALTYLDDGTPFLPVASRKRRHRSGKVAGDAFDDLSFVDVASPALEDHLTAVGDAAARIAERLGLPDQLTEVVKRAGDLHDLGKLEPRFQRWLDSSGRASAPLAKSDTPWYERERTRTRSGWPKGGRHELISGRIAAEAVSGDYSERELVLHLIQAHHGHGRPLVPVVQDQEPTKFRAPLDRADAMVSGDLSLPDWEQPRRFRMLCNTYGYWGVALLEAIVRQADHAASAQSEVI